ncbi:unnamed protein product [Thelazia callipaeda]|uniref:DNA mismatch repair protein n=1 Tax=Thelazia callipaeda TaxID=103827 RepID=A0A0N5CR47_THECL|nr:unnamed protein product [Thelazia callipaeda]
MAAKKQSSLLSFFIRDPNSKSTRQSALVENQMMNTPKNSTPLKASLSEAGVDVENLVQIDDPTSSKLIEQSLSGVLAGELSSVRKLSALKRRRVLISSDSEDDNGEIEKIDETDKKITKSKKARSSLPPQVTSLKRPDVSKPVSSKKLNRLSNTSGFSSESSRQIDGNKSLENPVSLSTSEGDLECARFPHLDFEFLQPDRIRDAAGHLSSHPDYCPRTLYVPEAFMKKQTPGHRQWWAAKSAFFDTILFFKVGKFYELYHMDAVVGVENLNLNYMRGSFAHCGFPEIAYGRFADQLVNRGYKVARVEQTETPTQLENRNKAEKINDKVVRREVCNITTPGTRTCGVLDGNDEQNALDSMDATARYLYAIAEKETDTTEYGVCFIDTTVGRFYIGCLSDSDSRSSLRTLFANYQPAQILFERGRVSSLTMTVYNSAVSAVPKEALVPKKEFLSSEHTLKLLANDKYFGASYDKWPVALLDMIDKDSLIPKCNPSYDACISALGAVVWYLKRCLIDVDMISMRQFEVYKPVSLTGPLLHEKAKFSLDHSEGSKRFWRGRRLVLDSLALKHLNIIPLDGNKKAKQWDPVTAKYTLYNVINKCITSAGKRLLRQWVCAPVCDCEIIESRQDAIEWLSKLELKKFIGVAEEHLRKVPDLERLVQKIHTLGLKYRADEHPDSRAQLFETMRYNKRKIRNLVQALEGFERIQDLHEEFVTNFSQNRKTVPFLLERCLGKEFPDVSLDIEHFKYNKRKIRDLVQVLEGFERIQDLHEEFNAFSHEKALEEGIIVPEKGVIQEYDDAVLNVNSCIHELNTYLNVIRKQLYCSSINFFGSGRSRYQLEIPEAIAANLGDDFELRSSRKGYKRMTTEELVKLVQNLDGAENQRDILRRDVMRRLFADFGDRSCKWLSVIERLAIFDVLLSLSRYHHDCGLKMCRPQFIQNSDKCVLKIKSGYHPSLAALSASGNGFTYIPNTVSLGGDTPSTILLTGPNMGGKSTLMRQVGVLVVLAQIGSFVPADEMKLTPVDRIFTRMGAGDRITAGQSTFYVELYETNSILRNATKHSLVIMDELGRGTSTYDGTAIAYAVLLDVSTRLLCRAFFSTHYHSLCLAVKNVSNIKAMHMACIVENENAEDPTIEDVTFLYTLADGTCPKSYGFFVAKLSGLKKEVIRTAFFASQRLNERKTPKNHMMELRRLAFDSECSADKLKEVIDLVLISS